MNTPVSDYWYFKALSQRFTVNPNSRELHDDKPYLFAS